MTDNALTYVRNRSLRELLHARGIKHLRTQAYRPRTNGKVERFHQTMAREWGYGMPTAHTRSQPSAATLVAPLQRGKPHSSLGGRPPISRVHNLRGQDT